MLFNQFEQLPPDPILGMANAFREDKSPDKVNLGIGVYCDEHGNSPVLACVKAAEEQLYKQQKTKTYLSPAGNPAYNQATQKLLFGETSPVLEAGRARTVQTPGGTGALSVAAAFIRASNPDVTIWIPTPTWANHKGLLPAAPLTVREYPYYDIKTGQLEFEKMLDCLRASVKPDDIVLLHGCCHNPTGADLDALQWESISALCVEKNVIPLVDIAYQGFSEGVEDDAFAVRLLSEKVPEMIVANSYAKNFAIYRERVGALTIISESEADAEQAYPHLLRVIRHNYSMPPDHGAALVSLILSNNQLRTQWLNELAEMRARINSVRKVFAESLMQKTGNDYNHIMAQRGMFSMLDLPADTAARMKSEFHIFMAGSGRINIAGLNSNNIEYVTDSLAQFLPRA